MDKHLASALVAGVLLILSGCGNKSSTHSVTPSPPVAQASDDGSVAIKQPADPCGLLDPKEVEAALGAPLAVVPFRSAGGQDKAMGMPVHDGPDCRYETADFKAVHLQVSFEGGINMLAVMRKFAGIVKQGSQRIVIVSKGTTIDGSWDDAQITGCCDFMAVLGDRAVDIDVAASDISIEQAATLADSALKRLDQPLSIDGNAAIANAKAHAAQRPQLATACDLVSREALEAIVGKLGSDPVSQPNYCELHTTQGIYFWKIDNAYGGYSTFRNLNAQLSPLADISAAAASIDNPQAQAVLKSLQQRTEQKRLSDPAWTAAMLSMRGLSAVKKDVQITFGPTLTAQQTEIVTKLAVAVMSRV